MSLLRIAFIACLFAPLGCDAAQDSSLQLDDLVNTRWVLERAEADGNTITGSSTEEKATIEFAQASAASMHSVSGYNGCNLYSGSYEIRGTDELHFSDIVQTYRACDEDEGRLESIFVKVLEDVSFFSVDDDRLVIENTSRNVSLVFVRTSNG